jgi:hypothetical protein
MPSRDPEIKKKSVYNWRLANPEKYRKQARKDSNKYFLFKRESMIFRMILITNL